MPAVAKVRTKKRRNPLEIAIGVVIIVATLYFAQDVLIPLALSVLLAFLLTPLVNQLQRLGLPAIPAVLATTLAAFLVIAGLGTVVGTQLYGLANHFDDYRDEIKGKYERVTAFGGRIGDKFKKATETVAETPLATSAPSTDVRPTLKATADAVAKEADQNPRQTLVREAVNAPATPSRGASSTQPVYVVDASNQQSNFGLLFSYVNAVLSPLGTGALVVVFVVFMLLDRHDLRDRAIRLISRGKYTVTTRALDDAGHRISRYVLAQTVVNGSYGLIVSLGLFIIGLYFSTIKDPDGTIHHVAGFPSWVLWGLLAAVLRFIPYVGPVVAAMFPLALSLAVYHGFTVFVVVGVMLILIELVSNNVMEPWLYGSSTGLSTMAILVAAVFWTWLWGPIGLFMSTPLTVCIVVLGKHVSQLKFLDVMLGDQAALPPGVRFYQRLLAGDAHEATLVMAEVAKRDGADMVPDNVLLPALRLSRRDQRDGDLTADEETTLLDTATELLTKRATLFEDRARAAAAASASIDADPIAIPAVARVLGCPAHHRSEELALEALNQLGLPTHYGVDTVSSRLMHAQIEQRIRDTSPGVVFIAVLPPGGMPQAQYLCKRLRKAFPDLPIVLGYFGRTRSFDRLLVRMRKAGANYVTTSMAQSRNQILAILRPQG